MMCRVMLSVSLVLSVSCAGASDPVPGSSKGAQAQAPIGPSPASEGDAKAPGPRAADGPCTLAEARYLKARSDQDRCERDQDCAAIYPGLCPHGPYYMHVSGDHATIDASAKAVAEVCERSKCEMPMPLGVAHCEAGHCVAGRTPPKDGPMESCWDTKITYMQGARPYLASSYEHLQGITPLHAVGVPAKGTLRISARRGCTGCELKVSEHNTGMSRLVKGQPFTPEPRDPSVIRPVPSRMPPMGQTQHLEFPVQPGPYFIVMIGGVPADVQYEIELRDANGDAMEPNRRGVIHQRICEG